MVCVRIGALERAFRLLKHVQQFLTIVNPQFRVEISAVGASSVVGNAQGVGNTIDIAPSGDELKDFRLTFRKAVFVPKGLATSGDKVLLDRLLSNERALESRLVRIIGLREGGGRICILLGSGVSVKLKVKPQSCGLPSFEEQARSR